MDIGYAGALLGGLMSLLSPCSVMLLPAFFAYAFGSPAKLMARTGIFYLGLVTTLVPLGVLAGVLGSLMLQNRAFLIGIASAFLILAGLIQILGVPIPGITRRAARDGATTISVYLLGTVYAVAGVCAGPILGSVLTLAGMSGNPIYGGMMLALYALGMCVPLVIIASVWKKAGARSRSWMRPRSLHIGRWQNTWTMIVSGLLTVGLGLLLLFTDGTASLGGTVAIGTQFAAESWLVQVASHISNAAFIGVGVIALAAFGGTLVCVDKWRRRRDPEVEVDVDVDEDAAAAQVEPRATATATALEGAGVDRLSQ